MLPARGPGGQPNLSPAAPIPATGPPGRGPSERQRAGQRAPQQQQQQLAKGRRPTKGSPGGRPKQPACKWMPLRDFKRVNFETGELILRDRSGRPCYLLSLTAFVRVHSDAYFPLRNFRPGGYAVLAEGATSGAERLPLDCSVPELVGAGSVANVSLLPAGRSRRPFREQLSILVDCGHLLLRTRSDGSYLALESISFAQGAESAGSSPGPPEGEQGQQQVVFSSSGPGPLLLMPLVSRFVCQSRVQLASSGNGTQLVLDRFELQRLVGQPPPEASSAGAAASSSSSASLQPATGAPDQQVGDGPPALLRSARDTTILFKAPVEFGE